MKNALITEAETVNAGTKFIRDTAQQEMGGHIETPHCLLVGIVGKKSSYKQTLKIQLCIMINDLKIK